MIYQCKIDVGWSYMMVTCIEKNHNCAVHTMLKNIFISTSKKSCRISRKCVGIPDGNLTCIGWHCQGKGVTMPANGPLVLIQRVFVFIFMSTAMLHNCTESVWVWEILWLSKWWIYLHQVRSLCQKSFQQCTKKVSYEEGKYECFKTKIENESRLIFFQF